MEYLDEDCQNQTQECLNQDCQNQAIEGFLYCERHRFRLKRRSKIIVSRLENKNSTDDELDNIFKKTKDR